MGGLQRGGLISNFDPEGRGLIERGLNRSFTVFQTEAQSLPKLFLSKRHIFSFLVLLSIEKLLTEKIIEKKREKLGVYILITGQTSGTGYAFHRFS